MQVLFTMLEDLASHYHFPNSEHLATQRDFLRQTTWLLMVLIGIRNLLLIDITLPIMMFHSKLAYSTPYTVTFMYRGPIPAQIQIFKIINFKT